MSRRLWPLLPLGVGEAPLSHMSRLARLHGATPHQLCAIYDLDLKGVVDGEPVAVAAFAALAGADPTAMAREAPVRVSERVWSYKGETIGQRHLNRKRIRVCTACLAEDVSAAGPTRHGEVAAFLRADWCLIPFQSCRRHRRALIAIGEAEDAYLDAAAVLHRHLRSEGRSPSTARDAAPSPYLDYLASRLEAPPGGGWLDRFTWSGVVDACETVGVVATHGPRAATRTFAEEARCAAGEPGHAILRGGEAAIRTFLHGLDRNYEQSDAQNDGPQARYGALHKRLAGLPPGHELLALRGIVASHIGETTPVGPGDAIFGIPVEKRVLHSVQTASREFGIHPKRLRKILVSEGLLGPRVDPRSDERSTFSADAAADLLAKMRTSMSLAEAEAYLNAGRVHARLLMTQGFIKPFATHAEGRGVDKNFAKADLDAFLARISADAVPVVRIPPGASHIATAAKRANCGAGEIVRLILGGELGWIGALAGIAGYGSILVDVEEVKGKIRGAPLEGLSLRQVEQRLRTKSKVVAALVGSGLLKVEDVVNPINRCPTRVVSEAALKSFTDQHVSLFQLTKDHGRHSRHVTRALEALGVAPVLTREVAGTPFYLRSNVEGLVVPP